MFRIAVCDDEKSVREQMERILSGYTKRECLTDCFASGEELIKSENRYDVIFLDIDMAGINGIEAAKRLRENPYPILKPVFGRHWLLWNKADT